MKKVIIAGAGISGLSAAVYALKAGYEVEIYEKHTIPGGECTGWNRKGHHIDNCIHWLTGTGKGTGLRELWEEIGALTPESEFVENDKFYTSRVGEQEITLWKDLERTQKELLQAAPEDREEILKLMEHIGYAVKCTMPVEKPMDMMGIKDYVKMGKEMADMPKVIKEYGKINMQDLADRFQSPLMKCLITDYMPDGYQASSYIVSYATMVCGNGELPVKGSLAMAQRIAEQVKKMGGKIFCGCDVERVLVNGKSAEGIELKDGRKIKGDYIILALDAYEAFSHLLGEKYMDKKWRSGFENNEKYPLQSAYQTAFSIDKAAFGDTGFVIFDCEPFQAGTRTVSRISVKSYAYEPSFAPEGKTVLQTNICQYDEDYDWWKGLNQEQYANEKARLASEIEQRIIAEYPSLKGRISLLDCWSPLTYTRYCRAYHGAYMSFITLKDVKSFQSKGTIKGLRNVFMAGQWLMAPGGLPTAAATGKFAVQRILKKEKRDILAL